MEPLTVALVILLALLAAATAVVGFLALQRPVLWRMGVRNAGRRPRQTATVVAGLMIGTAIIASALVAGDSAGGFVRGAVYESLGPIDETVRIDGFPFYPQDAAEALAADPRVASHFDGLAANVIWEGTADVPHTGLFEPRVALVGYDPVADAAFGDFSLRGGGSTDGRGLGPDEAIVTEDLADKLELRPGDRIRVSYTMPIDPLRPSVLPFEGELSGASLPRLPQPSPAPATEEHALPVPEGATQVRVAVLWDPRPADGGTALTSLRSDLESPDGGSWTAGGPGSLPPLWLNVTPPAGRTLSPGDWTLRVSGQPAVQTAYQGAAVVLVPAYGTAFDAGGPAGAGGGPTGALERFLQDLEPPRGEAELTVAAVTDGGRGDQYGFGEAAFLHIDALQAMLDRERQVNTLKLSNPGGVEAGAAGTEEALRILEAALADVKAASPHPAVQALEIEPVKRDYVALADEAGQTMTGFLLFAGSLSVITGLLLIVNIFTMLAEERRSELGMARAVGMRRGAVVRMFLFEGSLYAAAAAAVGALLGLGLAYLMVQGLNRLVAGRLGDFPPVPFVVEWEHLALAFAAGAVLTFATVAYASNRASRLNIVRAIRRIEEPDRPAGRLRVVLGSPLAVAGLLLSVAGWVLPSFSLQVFGPLVLVLGLGAALRRYLPRRRIDPFLAALLGAYYAATFFLITEFEDLEEANLVGPIRGVLMTLCIVVLVTYWEWGPRTAGRALARMKRLRAVAKPAMNYPQHKKFRTGMTLAMFSLVLLAIGFFSIFGALFDVDPATQTGDYDIEATTTLDVDGLAGLAAHDRGLLPEGLVTENEHLARHFAYDPDFITVGGGRTGRSGPDVGHNVYGYGETFPASQRFRLLWRLPEYATDQEAYEAVLAQDDLVIAAYTYSTDERGQDLSHEVGETLRMHFADGVREYTVIGIQEQYHFPGVFLAKDAVEGMFPRTDDLFLMRLAPGADAGEAAKLLERNHQDAGMDAEASKELVKEEQATFRQILGAMQLFLGLGLVVGVLSLGIVTSRSVMERRQEIGMMRALGYTGPQVRTVFLLEVTLTILLAAVVGVASSIVVTYGLWSTVLSDFQYPYTIPWGEIGLILLVAYLTTLLATAAPMRRASRTPPAEAVRYIE